MSTTTLDKATHVYIGRKRCGCIVAFSVDLPDRSQSVARDLAEFIRGGLTVERVPLSPDLRLQACPHKDADLFARGAS